MLVNEFDLVKDFPALLLLLCKDGTEGDASLAEGPSSFL